MEVHDAKSGEAVEMKTAEGPSTESTECQEELGTAYDNIKLRDNQYQSTEDVEMR